MMLALAAMIVAITCIFDALRCRNAFEDERRAHADTLIALETVAAERDHAIENLHASQRLLREAIRALPDTPRGRQLGDAITLGAWSNRKVDHLARHVGLHAVDDPTGGAA